MMSKCGKKLAAGVGSEGPGSRADIDAENAEWLLEEELDAVMADVTVGESADIGCDEGGVLFDSYY